MIITNWFIIKILLFYVIFSNLHAYSWLFQNVKQHIKEEIKTQSLKKIVYKTSGIYELFKKFHNLAMCKKYNSINLILKK